MKRINRTFLLFLFLTVGALLAYAASERRLNVDTLKVGDPSSANDIVVDFDGTRKIKADNGDGTLQFTNNGTDYFEVAAVGAATTQSNTLQNISFDTSVGSGALTVALKTQDGGDPSAGDPIKVSFRDATATNGDYEVLSIESALSLVVSSGSTLGQKDGVEDLIYVYLVNNAGTPLLALSGFGGFDEGSLHSTTAEGGAGAADSNTSLYASSAVSDKAIRFIGRFRNTQATAGTWASAGSELSLLPLRNSDNIAGLYTVASMNGAPSCNYSFTNDTLGTLGADTDCDGVSLDFGEGQPPSTKLLAWNYPFLPEGRYKVTMQFQVVNSTSSGTCYFRINDGTNSSGNAMTRTGSTVNHTTVTLIGVFEYDSPQADLTFELFGREPAATTCEVRVDEANSREFMMTVERFPLN